MQKQNQLTLVVAISSALALTACGGGGSSGGSTARPSTPIVTPTTGGNANVNTNTGTTNTGTTNTGTTNTGTTNTGTTNTGTTNTGTTNTGTTNTGTTNTGTTNTGTTNTGTTNTGTTNTGTTNTGTTNTGTTNTGTTNTGTTNTGTTNTGTTNTGTTNTGTTNTGTTNTGTTNTGTTNTDAKIFGEVGIIDGEVADINSDNIKKINVNGKTFDLSPLKTSTNFSKAIVDEIEMHASGTHMKHAKYGFIIDWHNDVEYLFYQGEKTPTANMPNSGIANYVGQSLYICGDCDDEVIQGTSKLSVDFGKKTLSGSISNAQASNVALNATISGNTFSGINGAGTETRGAFFGDKAQEISGIFNNDSKDFAGAFGATKQ